MAASKVAIVTGAGSGIGRASALALQSAGYSVALAGRRIAELEKTRRHGKSIRRQNVSGSHRCQRPAVRHSLFAQGSRTVRPSRCPLQHAGLNAPGIPIEDLPYETWTAIVNVNLTGAFLCAQAAFKQMKDQNPRGGPPHQ